MIITVKQSDSVSLYLNIAHIFLHELRFVISKCEQVKETIDHACDKILRLKIVMRCLFAVCPYNA